MTDEFVWNVVIDKIAALAGQGALAGTNLRIYTVWPTAGEECQTPVMFPARDPTISFESLKYNTFGGAARPSRGGHKTAVYSIHWVYLHTELTQEIITGGSQKNYEPVILSNLSKLCDELVAQYANLGVSRVEPSAISVDGDYVSPISGKSYMGARFSVRCTEFIHFSH